MDDDDFKVTISGPGIKIDQTVSRDVANRMVTLVLTGTAPAPASSARVDILRADAATVPEGGGNSHLRQLTSSSPRTRQSATSRGSPRLASS